MREYGPALQRSIGCQCRSRRSKTLSIASSPHGIAKRATTPSRSPFWNERVSSFTGSGNPSAATAASNTFASASVPTHVATPSTIAASWTSPLSLPRRRATVRVPDHRRALSTMPHPRRQRMMPRACLTRRCNGRQQRNPARAHRPSTNRAKPAAFSCIDSTAGSGLRPDRLRPICGHHRRGMDYQFFTSRSSAKIRSGSPEGRSTAKSS